MISPVTLVASAPEVQYVALRNIDLLLQAKPDILSKELRVFFCKYNDPPYVKLQKLEIMVRIANDKNFEQLLAELKEYALEVDMDFVRRAVKAIGQVAIKIENASEKCVNALLDLIATKVNYVVQEVVVVIKDILRKYPGYEGVIPTLCNHIDELDEPNARGSLIWIVGEYAEKINNADEILSSFVEGFLEEFTQVSGERSIYLSAMAVLTNPFQDSTANPHGRGQALPEEAGKQPGSRPECAADGDGRNRQPGHPGPSLHLLAATLWGSRRRKGTSCVTRGGRRHTCHASISRRLLTRATSMQNIVLSQKPAITTTMTSLPTALLEQLLSELSTLASVYHKPPESFVGKGRFGADEIQRAAIQEQRQNAAEDPIAASVAAAAAANGTAAPQGGMENLLDIDFDGGAPAAASSSAADSVASPAAGTPSSSMADMMGLFDVASPSASAAGQNGMGMGMNDILGGFAGMDLSGTSAPPPAAQQLQQQAGGGSGVGEPKASSGGEDLLGLF